MPFISAAAHQALSAAVNAHNLLSCVFLDALWFRCSCAGRGGTRRDENGGRLRGSEMEEGERRMVVSEHVGAGLHGLGGDKGQSGCSLLAKRAHPGLGVLQLAGRAADTLPAGKRGRRQGRLRDVAATQGSIGRLGQVGPKTAAAVRACESAIRQSCWSAA
ncbi:hypothetical protein MAPG_02077 [Magnaporthiopsis poae ATCC 64411]|uniref:Uncharacterized protein n=1 Tax=Magnaporthiopsis poae (strain ATCC 64411 / 73-15) TaxID=644358 RepID=A0A0C4DQD8_MAGP6|nr:hypothetical protein MAPG_02077 [Magnaporthiopsis poae ATCC 64411]